MSGITASIALPLNKLKSSSCYFALIVHTSAHNRSVRDVIMF